MPDRFPRQRGFNFERRAIEAHRPLPDPFLDNLVESDKRAATNEKNLLGVDLNIFLVWMFAAALWRDIAGAAFQNL